MLMHAFKVSKSRGTIDLAHVILLKILNISLYIAETLGAETSIIKRPF